MQRQNIVTKKQTFYVITTISASKALLLKANCPRLRLHTNMDNKLKCIIQVPSDDVSER